MALGRAGQGSQFSLKPRNPGAKSKMNSGNQKTKVPPCIHPNETVFPSHRLHLDQMLGLPPGAATCSVSKGIRHLQGLATQCQTNAFCRKSKRKWLVSTCESETWSLMRFAYARSSNEHPSSSPFPRTAEVDGVLILEHDSHQFPLPFFQLPGFDGNATRGGACETH